jgi:HSP20 family protein
MYVTRHSIFNTGNLNPVHASAQQVFDRLLTRREPSSSPVANPQWSPRVDIREDEQRFVILADIPGIDPALIEVSMDNGLLSIKGERPGEAGDAHGKGAFTRVERTCGTFNRRFSLPESADAESITASGNHGVLEIVIPKKALPTPRRITINSGH